MYGILVLYIFTYSLEIVNVIHLKLNYRNLFGHFLNLIKTQYIQNNASNKRSVRRYIQLLFSHLKTDCLRKWHLCTLQITPFRTSHIYLSVASIFSKQPSSGIAISYLITFLLISPQIIFL